MEFSEFISQAWADHADAAQAVALRLPSGVARVADEGQLSQLMNLAHHVHGEHLGDWQGGIAFIEGLKASPAFDPDGTSGQACARFVASLELCQGASACLDALSQSDRIRVAAMAAGNLAERDSARSVGLLQDAIARAHRAGLSPTDPAHRALAIAGNHLACTLEDRPQRSAEEREFMILAARTARHHWALAGTWLEVERAEYRLAMTWLKAGDLEQARKHAQTCLEIVDENNGAALERFFGWEALGVVERAAGNSTDHASALAHATEAFALLAEGDKSWCARSLARLADPA